MIAHKWDVKTKQYRPYILPKGSRLFSKDINEIVACSKCGLELKFGYCYTSRTIHNFVGFGYGVCETCYQEELRKERII